MFPHERSLVERMKDEPFALVGVNSDGEQADALKKTKFVEEKITWRSFSNGPEGPGGPIASKWMVRGWPTLFLIDAKGVIRKKWLGGPDEKELDGLIDELVAEAKGAPAAKAAEHAPEKKAQ